MKTSIKWGGSDYRFPNSIELKDIEFETKIFSGGEVQTRLLDMPDPFPKWSVTITAYIKNSNDLMELLLLTNTLQNLYLNVHLICPYLPYARQDRICFSGEAFSLEILANIINAQNYKTIELWDVHSDVALKLIKNSINIPVHDLLQHKALANDPVLIAPDYGSYKKVSMCAQEYETVMIHAEKVRNPDNGEITGTVVHNLNQFNKENNFLIIDDICDGGRTFIEIAKVLKQQNITGEISLHVTHGIFSKGFDVFNGLIDKIYVTNCFVDDVPDFVYVGV